MIRSSKHTTKFCNAQKLCKLERLERLFKQLVTFYMQEMISGKMSYAKFLSSPLLPSAGIISHSQWKQVAYKQASQIIKSNLTYVKNKCFRRYKKLYAQCMKEGRHKKFTSLRFSKLKINYLKRIKIDLKNVSIDIDNRLFDVQKDITKEFDEFILLRLPWFLDGKKRADSIKIPLKHHKHSLKYTDWDRRNTIKLVFKRSGTFVSLIYEKEDKAKPEYPKTEIGIDIGVKKLISDSNGVHYGKNLEAIYEKIARKKRGSQAYLRALTQRTQETNRVGNEFFRKNDFELLVMEDLKAVKHKSKLARRTNNKLQYWSYRTLIGKLERLSEEEGFFITKVNPAYTSQQCSCCGLVDKSNRNGEIYQCGCGMVMDADQNAAVNILQRGDYNPSSEKTIEAET